MPENRKTTKSANPLNEMGTEEANAMKLGTRRAVPEMIWPGHTKNSTI